MALPDTGFISISAINVELGRPATTPTNISELFSLARGAINRTLPNRISYFRGYANIVSIIIGTEQTTPLAAYSGAIDKTIYHGGSGTYPIVGDQCYNTVSGTTVFNGNGNWFRVFDTDNVIRVSNVGLVLEVVNGNQTLSVSPTARTVVETSGSFVIAVTSNTSWTVSDNQTWTTITPSSGTGNANVTVNYTAHTGTGDRVANINFVYALGNTTTVLTQKDFALQNINLGSGTTSAAACAATQSSYKINSNTWSQATEISIELVEGIGTAPSSWYSDGFLARFWTGTAFTSSTICS
jgi:hypothetical protein